LRYFSRETLFRWPISISRTTLPAYNAHEIYLFIFWLTQSNNLSPNSIGLLDSAETKDTKEKFHYEFNHNAGMDLWKI